MESILTPAQRERVGGEVVMHAHPGTTARELVDATAQAVNRLESLAASAAVWEAWKSGQVEVSWDEGRQEVSLHAAEPEDEDEFDPADQISYPAFGD